MLGLLEESFNLFGITFSDTIQGFLKKLDYYEGAIADYTRAIEFNPQYAKAYRLQTTA